MSHAIFVAKNLTSWTTDNAELYASKVIIDGTPYEPGTGRSYERLTNDLHRRIKEGLATVKSAVEQGKFSAGKYALACERFDKITAWLRSRRNEVKAGSSPEVPPATLGPGLLESCRIVAVLSPDVARKREEAEHEKRKTRTRNADARRTLEPPRGVIGGRWPCRSTWWIEAIDGEAPVNNGH